VVNIENKLRRINFEKTEGIALGINCCLTCNFPNDSDLLFSR